MDIYYQIEIEQALKLGIEPGRAIQKIDLTKVSQEGREALHQIIKRDQKLKFNQILNLGDVGAPIKTPEELALYCINRNAEEIATEIESRNRHFDTLREDLERFIKDSRPYPIQGFNTPSDIEAMGWVVVGPENAKCIAPPDLADALTKQLTKVVEEERARKAEEERLEEVRKTAQSIKWSVEKAHLMMLEQELEEWIAKNGSPQLKASHEIQARSVWHSLYLDERIEAEYPEWIKGEEHPKGYVLVEPENEPPITVEVNEEAKKAEKLPKVLEVEIKYWEPYEKPANGIIMGKGIWVIVIATEHLGLLSADFTEEK